MANQTIASISGATARALPSPRATLMPPVCGDDAIPQLVTFCLSANLASAGRAVENMPICVPGGEGIGTYCPFVGEPTTLSFHAYAKYGARFTPSAAKKADADHAHRFCES